jgi:hypothetical protein
VDTVNYHFDLGQVYISDINFSLSLSHSCSHHHQSMFQKILSCLFSEPEK